MPYRSLFPLPADWLVKRVHDHECRAYLLWRLELRDRPDARLQFCSPPVSSWAPVAPAVDGDHVLTLGTRLSLRDRDVELRLATQPDGTWFGDAEATYWPPGGAAEGAVLHFDGLTEEALATLLGHLLAVDLVPAPEIEKRRLLFGAYRDQCLRERSAPTEVLETGSIAEISERLKALRRDSKAP